jgi:hypothetical protein
MNSECKVTIHGRNSTVSGMCAGDMWTESSNQNIHVEANHCVIDINCGNDGSCIRNVKCPLVNYQELVPHDLNKKWTTVVPPK